MTSLSFGLNLTPRGKCSKLSFSITTHTHRKLYWETQEKVFTEKPRKAFTEKLPKKERCYRKQEQLWESSWSLASCLLVFIYYSSVKLFSTIFTTKSATVTKSRDNFGLHLLIYAWDSSSRFFYSSIHCFNLKNNNKSAILIN